jgi:hypothetical protein
MSHGRIEGGGFGGGQAGHRAAHGQGNDAIGPGGDDARLGELELAQGALDHQVRLEALGIVVVVLQGDADRGRHVREVQGQVGAHQATGGDSDQRQQTEQGADRDHGAATPFAGVVPDRKRRQAVVTLFAREAWLAD